MKKMNVCFLAICLAIFAFASYVEAAELIKHKEIKNQNIDVKIPYIVDNDSTFVREINKNISDNIMGGVNGLKKMMADTPSYVPSDRFSFQASYNIELNKNGLLSLTLQKYMYTGGAHGIPYKDSYLFDLKTSTQYNLTSIFGKNFDYITFLNTKINHIIATSDEWNNNDSINFKTVSDYTAFYLTDDKLVIHFPVYELGPYVIGSPHFEIPLREVYEHLNPAIANKLRYSP